MKYIVLLFISFNLFASIDQTYKSYSTYNYDDGKTLKEVTLKGGKECKELVSKDLKGALKNFCEKNCIITKSHGYAVGKNVSKKNPIIDSYSTFLTFDNVILTNITEASLSLMLNCHSGKTSIVLNSRAKIKPSNKNGKTKVFRSEYKYNANHVDLKFSNDNTFKMKLNEPFLVLFPVLGAKVDTSFLEDIKRYYSKAVVEDNLIFTSMRSFSYETKINGVFDGISPRFTYLVYNKEKNDDEEVSINHRGVFAENIVTNGWVRDEYYDIDDYDAYEEIYAESGSELEKSLIRKRLRAFVRLFNSQKPRSNRLPPIVLRSSKIRYGDNSYESSEKIVKHSVRLRDLK